jgi:hypothetical protein
VPLHGLSHAWQSERQSDDFDWEHRLSLPRKTGVDCGDAIRTDDKPWNGIEAVGGHVDLPNEPQLPEVHRFKRLRPAAGLHDDVRRFKKVSPGNFFFLRKLSMLPYYTKEFFFEDKIGRMPPGTELGRNDHEVDVAAIEKPLGHIVLIQEVETNMAGNFLALSQDSWHQRRQRVVGHQDVELAIRVRGIELGLCRYRSFDADEHVPDCIFQRLAARGQFQAPANFYQQVVIKILT